MAYAFPLSLADFVDRLETDFESFALSEAMTSTETEGGAILTARRGARLWSGSARVVLDIARRQEPVRGLLDLLREPGASFLIRDRACEYPLADPDGSALGAASVVVQDAPLDRRLVVLEGAPAGYALSEGDHLSIDMGFGRISYHRILQGGTFSSGFSPPRTGALELRPILPAAVTTGMTVTLVRPALKAIIRPGTIKGGDRVLPYFAQPVTFDWIQTLG